MNLEEFIQNFAGEFDETPMEQFTPTTEYRTLDEWNSLTALSIIAMVDEQYEITITGADLRNHNTIEELYNYIASK